MVYLDTYYENASPLFWEQADDGAVEIQFIHDHERFSVNRQFTHFNFKVVVLPEDIAKPVRLRIRPVNNCWSGQKHTALKREKDPARICYNGVDWKSD